MTSDFAPLIAGRSKMTPAWVASIAEDSWTHEIGWVRDGFARLPLQCSATVRLQIALLQCDGHWIAVATGNGACFRFDLLSFIALWNDCAGQKAPSGSPGVSVELFADVTGPYVLRHPSVVPMEVSFDHRTDRFRRSIVYSIFDASEEPD